MGMHHEWLSELIISKAQLTYLVLTYSFSLDERISANNSMSNQWESTHIPNDENDNLG